MQHPLLQNPIVFHRAFAVIAGSINAAIMLQQAIYWCGRTRNKDGWFWKTQEEWQFETTMTRTELETARKLLISAGLIEYKLAGLPCKGHYRAVESKIMEALSTVKLNVPESCKLSPKESCEQDGDTEFDAVRRNPTNSVAAAPQAITETTAETTAKNTAESGFKPKPPQSQKSYLTTLREVTPSDGSLDPEWRDFAVREIPGAHIDTIYRMFSIHFEGRLKTARGWYQAWRNWVLREKVSGAGGTRRKMTTGGPQIGPNGKVLPSV